MSPKKQRVRGLVRRSLKSWHGILFLVGGSVASAGGIATSVYSAVIMIDGRWDQRAVAADFKTLQGQINYQTNEVKLGQARQNLDMWQQRWIEFELKSPAEKNSPVGRQYQRIIDDKIGQYKHEVEYFERALENQRSGKP